MNKFLGKFQCTLDPCPLSHMLPQSPKQTGKHSLVTKRPTSNSSPLLSLIVGSSPNLRHSASDSDDKGHAIALLLPPLPSKSCSL